MIVILGKNGAGKSYLLDRLAEKGFCKVVNYTTRPMRENEQDGVDYFFLTNEQFESLIAQGFFIEHKKLGDNYYGTSKEALGKNSVFVAGNLADLKKFSDNEVVPVYVNASIDQRYRRVKKRKSTESEIFKRFHGESFKYLDKFKGFFINNESNNEKSLNEFLSLINQNGEILSKDKMKENSAFLKECIKSFRLSDLRKIDDPMLVFLKYEEYLMRVLSLAEFSSVDDLKKVYFDNMKRFMENFNLEFKEKDGEVFVTFTNEAHHISFDNKKVGKMMGLED